MTSTKRFISGLLFVLMLTGCQFGFGTGEVSGTVLVDGQPMGGFEITFSSTSDKELILRGIVVEDGSFRLARGRGKLAIPVGEYRVTVIPVAIGETTPAPKIVLSEKYTDLHQAAITKTVRSGKNEITIEIESGQ